MSIKKPNIPFLSMLIIILVIGASACGRAADDAPDPDALAFLAAFHDIDLGGAWVQTAAATKDALYIYASEYIEAEERLENKLWRLSIADGSTEEMDVFDLDENEYVSAMVLGEQGNITLLAGTWSESGSSFTLYEVGADGQKLSEKDISDALSLGNNGWLQAMYGNNSGDLLFTAGMGDGTYQLIVTDQVGNVKGKITQNDYIDSVVFTDAGDVYISAWGPSGMGLRKADFTTSSFGPEISLSTSGSGSLRFAPGGSTGVLLNSSDGLYECDLETGEVSQLLNWIDCDVNASDIRYFGELDGGAYWAMNQLYMRDRSMTELITLSPTTYGQLPTREYLSYGGMYLDDSIRTAIIHFNKSNDQYRIRVKDYAGDDYEGGLNQFNTDLTSGQAPDIIDLSSLSFRQLASKGVFADLTPYLTASEIDGSAYLENIMRAYSLDEKLYGLMSGFSISTLAGHGAKIGDYDRWTLEEMIDWAEQFPGAKLMRTTASSLMHSLVYQNIDKFIDWETGNCNFTGDEFLGVLEFVSTFGDEWDDWNDPDRIGTHEGFQDGHYLLLDYYVNSLEAMQLIDAMFDGDAKYIGLPTESGSGIMINPNGAIAISDKSRHKDGAFAFIEYLLSDDFQSPSKNTNRYNIPVQYAAIEEIIDEATTAQMESGREMITTSWGYDDLQVEIFASRNKEFVDVFYDLIQRADGLRDYDTQIVTIIQEEADSFFSGQKSAAEAAEIIQSRVQLYVNENR